MKTNHDFRVCERTRDGVSLTDAVGIVLVITPSQWLA